MENVALSFTAPLILCFLILLPVLWWLLKLTPPAPRKILFPAIALLRGITAKLETPYRTPWWLLLLRMLIASLIIAAFAGPLWNSAPLVTSGGDLLIVIDNDWASARDWDAREVALHHLILDAEHQNQQVILLPDAPALDGSPLQLLGPMAAKAAYAVAQSLTPVPFAAHWQEAKAEIKKIEPKNLGQVVWLNSGLGGTEAENFLNDLAKLTSEPPRILSDVEKPTYFLTLPQNEANESSLVVTRVAVDTAAAVSLLAIGKAGQVVAHQNVAMAEGVPSASVTFEMPPEARNEIVRFDVEGSRTAAATLLLDESWQRRPVGLIGDKSEEDEHSLLSPLFYVDRALKPYADIHVAKLKDLLDAKMAVIVLTDASQLNDEEKKVLFEWVQKGGLLLRFAGERLATEQSPRDAELLPVALRTGDRAMGGSMSWATPQKLQAFPPQSPFKGLSIPSDVSVSRQILAEPSADIAKYSWASLEDGTPLITARPIGRGLSVLFHVPARSEWSNLPLSGLFVDMLRRIVDLSSASNFADVNFQSLPAKSVLDAFGDEQPPGPAVQAYDTATLLSTDIGPHHPPGYYGDKGVKHALNLGPSLSQSTPLRSPSLETYDLGKQEIDFAAYLLAGAFILMCVDLIISLFLRGLLVLSVKPPKAAIGLLFILSLHPFPTKAADTDPAAVELTSKTYIAYVETGNSEIDRISDAGLKGLARALERRTSIDEVGVSGVNVETDELVFFPLLYWPLGVANQPLSQDAIARVNDYLHNGGMILFDSGNADSDFSTSAMKSHLGNLDIPPLVRIPDNHVLHRSFYLLDQFPGRNAGGDLWLEPEELSTYDGVASVIAGSGGWASAWAVGDNGSPLFPCTPGGEEQREYAYRFGVNIVMYALTGNYKSDQLHAQALLEKLGR